MTKVFNRAISVAGNSVTINSIVLNAVEYTAGNITKCTGATIPTDGSAGFAVGAIWIDTDSGSETTFYVNEGSATSCDFNVIGTGAIGATGYTGYTGGLGSTETVDLIFTGTGTGQTGAVTAGSTIIGQYVKGVTGAPEPSHCKLSVASTTLTGTLTVAPGAGDYIEVSAVLALA